MTHSVEIFSLIHLGKETNMASKDVPRAELDPAALLPDWMREANADDACLEKQSEASMQKDIEYINVKEQDNASVKLVSAWIVLLRIFLSCVYTVPDPF